MNLYRILNLIDRKLFYRVLGLASGSALSTTMVVAIAAYAAKNINDSEESFVDIPLAIVFIASLVIYFLAESKMIARLAREIEKVIHELRMKLIHRIRHADLWKLEHFGQNRLYESITQNSKTLSSNSQYIAQAIRSIILLAMLLVYIAFISPLTFFILLAMLLLAGRFYYSMGKSLEKSQAELAENEGKLFEYVSDLFDGFKEQRLCSVRSQTLGEEFTQQSEVTGRAHSAVYERTWQQFVFGESTFNIMIGVVLFVIPAFSPSVSDELIKISSAVLFMGTPIFGLRQSLACGLLMLLPGVCSSWKQRWNTLKKEAQKAIFSK
jgi:putative ATP-binding cassette transporter